MIKNDLQTADGEVVDRHHKEGCEMNILGARAIVRDRSEEPRAFDRMQ